ncbi:hypothetical protein CC86DRAFT_366145 [Ophiobolus disseminans]|uniref:Uncharacterized protein n=1 Tax=Ophiobolus disseminans TaxID=1469910 RepID=A0A6A7AHB1_9PLEO|nr:hypothetical protein CC86DRAFT_366145 [Ophiobolus disseminans]
MASISNEDTQKTILRAVNSQRLEAWPGRYFSTFFAPDADIAKALLGTPNGGASGYFLAQHKQQLGNMFIAGVRVFLGTTYPNQPSMVFYVQQELPQKPGAARERTSPAHGLMDESSVVRVENNGTSMLREHVFRAKL